MRKFTIAFCIGLVLVAGAVISSAISNRPNPTPTSAPVLLEVIARATITPFSHDGKAGVGECGYFDNMGTLHRNGKVDPKYCDYVVAVTQFVEEIKIHTTHTPKPTQTQTPVVTSTPSPTPTVTTTNTPKPTDTPVVTETPTSTPKPTGTPSPKCNKGGGNGSEGCDPGNHPEKGNDDESGTPKNHKHN